LVYDSVKGRQLIKDELRANMLSTIESPLSIENGVVAAVNDFAM
jgi:hypothetical protein